MRIIWLLAAIVLLGASPGLAQDEGEVPLLAPESELNQDELEEVITNSLEGMDSEVFSAESEGGLDRAPDPESRPHADPARARPSVNAHATIVSLSLDGALTEEMVRTVLRRRMYDVRRCYGRAYEGSAEAPPTVEVAYEWTIGSNGVPGEIAWPADETQTLFRDCVGRHLGRIRYPSGDAETSVTVVLGFEDYR